MSEEIDHGKGIDDYYRRKREDARREHEKLTQMKKDGAPWQEIQKQEERWLQAGDTGD